MMEEEIWKDVEGYEGLYQVSNLGRVKSLERYQKNHNKLQYRKEHIMPLLFDSKHQYQQVCLCKNGVAVKYLIHRLVALAFIPNLYGKKEVNHIDGNKQNNRADNLEWCTRSENIKHAHRIGLADNSRLASKRNIWKAISKTRKKVVQYDLQMNIINIFESSHDADRKLSLFRGCVGQICRGKCKQKKEYILKYL